MHLDIVTCVAIDFCGTYAVTGSNDTTCIIWQIVQEDGVSVNLNQTPLHILYGHTSSVTCVDISIELDLVVSGSLDGTINIYNVHSGLYVKTLHLRTALMPDIKVINVKLSEQRHILAYSCHMCEQSEHENDELTKTQVKNYLFLKRHH